MSDRLAGEVLQDCLSEMAYEKGEGSFGQPVAASIPCQLRFVDSVDQDTERLHEALEDRGYSPLDTDPDRSIGGRRGSGDSPYYESEICSQKHYNRVKVLVFRGSVVRIYPKDEYVPTEDELADVIEALQVGFDAELEHSPIDGGDSSE